MKKEEPNMVNILVVIHLGVEGFPWNVVDMLFNFSRGNEIKRKSLWVAKVVCKAVVVPCVGEGVKACFKAD